MFERQYWLFVFVNSIGSKVISYVIILWIWLQIIDLVKHDFDVYTTLWKFFPLHNSFEKMSKFPIIRKTLNVKNRSTRNNTVTKQNISYVHILWNSFKIFQSLQFRIKRFPLYNKFKCIFFLYLSQANLIKWYWPLIKNDYFKFTKKTDHNEIAKKHNFTNANRRLRTPGSIYKMSSTSSNSLTIVTIPVDRLFEFTLPYWRMRDTGTSVTITLTI